MTAYQKHLRDVVAAQKRGEPRGIYSICSYNRYAIESATQQARVDDSVALIESTCNQVNQFGGYTGMRPMDFREYVLRIASSMGLPLDRVILGGDHLGPFPFRDEASGVAMDKAREMVRQYALSGCTKIHLDTSMRLADDPGDANTPLDPRVIAERCADLCTVAEAAYIRRKRENSRADAPVYVIGTEVPPPGGSDEAEEGLYVTKVMDLKETISITRAAFGRHDLHDAWQRVIAVVAEPGVGHGDHTVVDYDREKAKDLTGSIGDSPHLVFEGHSTDYQTTRALREMVEDGIAILKVGPALTFAARETIFMLQYVEEELLGHSSNVTLSRFRETLDEAMARDPRHWRGYYRGTEDEVDYARKYSLFDRARYYLVDEHVSESLELLISNLRSTDIPLPLISQFLPQQHSGVREGSLTKDPEAFIRDRISGILRTYSYAVGARWLAE
jgi:D-tagatose-1,6-bisphosphate aldolase subunit GatZ/KbaZ